MLLWKIYTTFVKSIPPFFLFFCEILLHIWFFFSWNLLPPLLPQLKKKKAVTSSGSFQKCKNIFSIFPPPKDYSFLSWSYPHEGWKNAESFFVYFFVFFNSWNLPLHKHKLVICLKPQSSVSQICKSIQRHISLLNLKAIGTLWRDVRTWWIFASEFS